MEEALKVPSWQIAPPVYRETDGEDIPLSLLGEAWIGLSANTAKMSTTKATLGKQLRKTKNHVV